MVLQLTNVITTKIKKPMKKLLAIAVILSIAIVSCKKSTTPAPSSNTQQQNPTNNQVDTSKAGKYRMVYCDSITELDSSIVLTLVYRTFQYMNPNDSSLKKVLYTIPNNFNTVSGKVKLSSTVIFYNENTNHNQPYIEWYNNIISGFYGDSKCNGGGTFNGDTLSLSFNVDPLVGNNFVMKCKYLKFQ